MVLFDKFKSKQISMKKASICTIFMLLIVCFSACGQTGNEQQESNSEQTTTSTEVKMQTESLMGIKYDITDQYKPFTEEKTVEGNEKDYICTYDDGTESRVMILVGEKEKGATFDLLYSPIISSDQFSLIDEEKKDYNSIKNVTVISGIFHRVQKPSREELIAIFEDDDYVYEIAMEDSVDKYEFERLMNSVHY